MLRQIVLSTVLVSITALPSAYGNTTESRATDQTISIQFDNGAPPIKAGEPALDYRESFRLGLGESFSVGGGNSSFSFRYFPANVEQVKLSVDVNPGDSFLNLSLPGGFHLTTNLPEQTTTYVREGEAMSIAYGYDSQTQEFANIKFTLEELVMADQALSTRTDQLEP